VSPDAFIVTQESFLWSVPLKLPSSKRKIGLEALQWKLLAAA